MTVESAGPQNGSQDGSEAPAPKVLLVIGDATEVTDTKYPMMRLEEAGYKVIIAAPDVRPYQLVFHESPEGWDITRESPGYMLDSDIAFRDINPAEYAGILISGGRAPEYIRYDDDLIRAVQWLTAAGRPVGSICHGIEVLAKADIIRGKRITCIPKCRFDAEVCGATFLDVPVVVDGNIITARSARNGGDWMREFIPALTAIVAPAETPAAG